MLSFLSFVSDILTKVCFPNLIIGYKMMVRAVLFCFCLGFFFCLCREDLGLIVSFWLLQIQIRNSGSL